MNRWSCWIEALPVRKVEELPEGGDYSGDMVFMAGGLYIWLEVRGSLSAHLKAT